MRKLATFFTTVVFFAMTSFSIANAQLLDTFDDQISNPAWGVVDNLLATVNADIVGMQMVENSDDTHIGFIIVGLDTPISSLHVYGLGELSHNIVYLGPAELGEDENGVPCFDWDLDGVFDYSGDGDSNDEAGYIATSLAVGFAYIGAVPAASYFASVAAYAGYADANPQLGIGIDRCA